MLVYFYNTPIESIEKAARVAGLTFPITYEGKPFTLIIYINHGSPHTAVEGRVASIAKLIKALAIYKPTRLG